MSTISCVNASIVVLQSSLASSNFKLCVSTCICDSKSASISEKSLYLSLKSSFQVLQKALEVWDLQVIPLDSPVSEPDQIDPELEKAFICHLQDHWFCIRKVKGEWYNIDCLYAEPEHLSKFYLSAYLDSIKGFGWSIFLVRGNFPKECPISSSEASNVFGRWLLPEDAERIIKSCNIQDHFPQYGAESLSDAEDEDLKAAIAASLMDSLQQLLPSGKWCLRDGK
ncbi:hypothetical protein DCAR_0830477 [Daucus carota subsp. sativus]|uniref:ubiquitinyl hydrolase 1 n=1 Tax=Daucus carota subsp. sativus TaxID=79200 RepID=A0AAF1B9A7_DAUCS|nr:hypothetical protein DCAR_0830477 [Daucus carota subsp. sativus]